jgi:hypothetical protein
MASAEFLSQASPASEIVNLDTGLLLDEIDAKIRAGNYLEDGGADGLVRTLGYVPDRENFEAVGAYSPGRDRVQDLAVAATFAAREPKAYKGRGRRSPHKLHILVEQADRYRGSTGQEGLGLDRLARFALAMSATAAERVKVGTQLVMVSDSDKITRVNEDVTNALDILSPFDKFTTEALSRQSTEGQQTATDMLNRGLGYMTDEYDGPKDESDACLVVSDFLSGAERSRNGELKGFDWEEPLALFKERLGDRLFIVRLTSPAQIQLPETSEFALKGRPITLDAGELWQQTEIYARLGQEKADRITGILKGFRCLDLSSQTKTPFSDVADFLFGTPQEYR